MHIQKRGRTRTEGKDNVKIRFNKAAVNGYEMYLTGASQRYQDGLNNLGFGLAQSPFIPTNLSSMFDFIGACLGREGLERYSNPPGFAGSDFS